MKLLFVLVAAVTLDVTYCHDYIYYIVSSENKIMFAKKSLWLVSQFLLGSKPFSDKQPHFCMICMNGLKCTYIACNMVNVKVKYNFIFVFIIFLGMGNHVSTHED